MFLDSTGADKLRLSWYWRFSLKPWTLWLLESESCKLRFLEGCQVLIIDVSRILLRLRVSELSKQLVLHSGVSELSKWLVFRSRVSEFLKRLVLHSGVSKLSKWLVFYSGVLGWLILPVYFKNDCLEVKL